MADSGPIRLGVFATHPVQYHVALWRDLASRPEIDLEVLYLSDHGVREGIDPGFGVSVAWDVPLFEGYRHRFLRRDGDIRKTWGLPIEDPEGVLRGGRYDWVLLQGYTHAFERQVVLAARKQGVRVLLRGEFTDAPRGGAVRSFLKRAYLRWFYGKVDRFCYIGEMARNHLLGLGVPGGSMTFSPYHVDTDLFARLISGSDRAAARAGLGIGEDAFVLLFSGKFIPRKNPGLILDALEYLGDRGGIHAIFLGSGPLEQEIRARGEAILGSRFLAPGFVNQSGLGPYLAAADLFILPSRYETWGLVVNEAMQFGVPVVVTDRVGCNPDLVVDGKTGFVIPDDDARALAARLEWASRHADAVREIGRRARERVGGYTPARAADGIVEAVRSFGGDADRRGAV